MLSRYRSNRAVTDALLAVDPDLDVFEAAALGYLDRLRARIDDDPAVVTSMSSDGYTALHFAAFFAKPEAARILLEAGAPVDVVAHNEMRVRPLHSAAAGRQTEICRLLLAAGAEVDARQAGGFTPLHEAAQSGDPEMVELFLSAGADPLMTTDDGKTAADLAEAAAHPDVATRLRSVATEVNG
jgi:ankyrin repeat protein